MSESKINPFGTGSDIDNPAEDPDADPSAILDADLRKLQEERNALFEQVARVTADFKNAQKRLESEKQQSIQFANTKVISSLLPVLDNFERAMDQDPAKTDSASILKGLRIVYDQLMTTLRQQQVEVIAPPPGTPFDPNEHQAIMQQPTDQYPDPTVTMLMQKGYAMHGRVLRPAQVAVSKID